jgi:hypothetical protein
MNQDRLKELFDYDGETGNLIRRVPTTRSPIGSIAGSRTHEYLQVRVDGQFYRNHRLVWLYVHGHFPEGEVDHIDGNGCNNRLSNLRSVTKSGNQRNRRISANSTSGFNGVSWRKQGQRWQANIRAGGKQISLGRFECLIDAVAARIRANNKYGFHYNHGNIRNP